MVCVGAAVSFIEAHRLGEKHQHGHEPHRQGVRAEQRESSDSAPEGLREELPGGPARYSAKRLRELLADELWLDELIDRAEEGGVALTGPGGFLPEMVKAVLERGLAAELTDHLGHKVGDPAGRGSPNSGNGTSAKRVRSEVGRCRWTCPVTATRPSSRGWCPRRAALGGLDDMIISLYAGGMTVRDIQHRLARTVGTELSHDTISKITDTVLGDR